MHWLIYILAMEGALAAALIYGVLRARTGAARRVAGAMVLVGLSVAAGAMVLAAGREAEAGLRLTLSLAAAAGTMWLAEILAARPGAGPQALRIGAPPAGELRWLIVAAVAQLGFLVMSAWWWSRWCMGRTPVARWMPPVEASAWGLGGAIVSGGLLIGAAVFGLLATADAGAAGEPDAGSGEGAGCGADGRAANARAEARVCWACWLMLAAVALRTLFVCYSVLLGALTNPVAPRYFWSRLMSSAGTLVTTRVLVGLILPAIYAALGLGAAPGAAARAEGENQFLPALVLVLLGELLGASLTAGLAGLAF